MSLKQPAGRIVVNTGVGNCEKVNVSQINEYSFLGDDRVHRYKVNGRPVAVNCFKKTLKQLGKIKF